jgi:hypothetical protein
MKVVCINNCWDPARGSVWGELTISKSYDVLSFIYEEPNGRKVEIPSSSVNSENYQKILKNSNKITIKDDSLMLCTFDINLFTTIEEFRERQLNELGI